MTTPEAAHLRKIQHVSQTTIALVIAIGILFATVGIFALISIERLNDETRVNRIFVCDLYVRLEQEPPPGTCEPFFKD